MIKLVQEHRLFFILYAAFLVAGAILLLTIDKGREIIFVNGLHTPWFDAFFLNVTRLAEAPAFILMLLVILFGGFGNGLILATTYASVGGLVQFLKTIVFDEQLRPSLYFSSSIQLNFVPGMEVARYHSFPSGHTALAFALFLSLCFITKNKAWSVAFFAMALLVGLSRVYLLQHFFIDVYFGSLLAVIITTLVRSSITQSAAYQKLTWRNKTLFAND
ncbi:MAG: phosphatase PAP2 family protein [Bacteroidetes bacterium]|nr:phosphatase PAP2 family protein [Bacteroidota bacterium]